VVHHYVDAARARLEASDGPRVAIDETAIQRGHNYITLCVDIDQARVLIAAFADDLAAHGGDPKEISEVFIDMSPAFVKGVGESLPKAEITFDKFNAIKIINEAVDSVRCAEQKREAPLRGTRHMWLRDLDNLSQRQRDTLNDPPIYHLKTWRAC
jgi:transposase